MSWIDSNTGTAAAVGPWTDYIYLASDAQGDNAVFVGKAVYPDTLHAGQQSVQLTQPIELPSTPGTYYLEVVADASGVNEGPNAANATTVDAAPITVYQEPLPDLVVSSITPLGSGILSGTTVPVTYTVTNQGDAPTNAAQWLDAIFISQSPSLVLAGGSNEILDQPLGVPVFAANPSYLLPGQSYTQTVNVPIPVSVSGMYYYYVATNRAVFHSLLDNFIYTGAVTESNANNDMTISRAVYRHSSPLAGAGGDVGADAAAGIFGPAADHLVDRDQHRTGNRHRAGIAPGRRSNRARYAHLARRFDLDRRSLHVAGSDVGRKRDLAGDFPVQRRLDARRKLHRGRANHVARRRQRQLLLHRTDGHRRAGLRRRIDNGRNRGNA